MSKKTGVICGIFLGCATFGSMIDVAQGISGDIFKVLQALTRSIPFTRAKIEALFGVKLDVVNENSYFVFLAGKGPQLSDATTVRSIDLRIAKANPRHRGFIVIEITGRCVTLQEVERMYGTLELTDAPRGRTTEEMFSYTANLPEGSVSFGFMERNPDCVSSISIEPKQSE